MQMACQENLLTEKHIELTRKKVSDNNDKTTYILRIEPDSHYPVPKLTL